MQTMNSNDIMCNGNSALSGSDHSLRKSSQKAANSAPAANLNWLIYMSFARGDFKYCKAVINHQFQTTYDYEYLYYMQVHSLLICLYILHSHTVIRRG